MRRINIHGIQMQMALLVIVPVVLGLLVMSVYAMRTISGRIEADVTADADNAVEAGSALAAEQLTELQERARTMGAYFSQAFYARAAYVTEGAPVSITATNQTTGEKREVTVPSWFMGGMPLTGDFTLVDTVQKRIGGVQTVFQRFDGGSLCISTNVMTVDGKRGVNTYFPADHPIVKTVDSGKPYIGRAFVVDQWYVAEYDPIFDQSGTVIGMLFTANKEADSAARLTGELARLDLGKSGFMSIFTGKGEMLVHPSLQGKTALDEQSADGVPYIKQMIEQKSGWLTYRLPGEKGARTVRTRVSYYEPRDWYIAATIYEDEAFASAARMRTITIALTAGLLLALVGLIAWFSRRLTRRIGRLADAARRIAAGRLDGSVDVRGRDEIGAMGAAFREMTDYLQGIAGVAAAIAAGDLTRDMQPHSEHDQLGNACAAMTTNLRGIIGQVRTAADDVTTTSDGLREGARQASAAVGQVSRTVTDMAAGAQDTARSTQVVTVTTEQLAQAIDGIARGAAEQARQVQAASATTAQMAAGVERVAVEAAAVATASEQTRVAAAQGAQAVRAMEVGSGKVEEGSARAGRTGEMLDEILRAVEATVTQVTGIAAAAREMSAGARGVVDLMGGISAVVEQNTAATAEMAAQSEQVSTAIQGIAAVAEENSASTEEVSASAEEMTGQVAEMSARAGSLAATAHRLQELVARFTLTAEATDAYPSDARPRAA